jgi:aminoglycoside 3-N-acetyltransferase
VADGADTVLDALLDVLGPDGLLVTPTFTFRTARFDPRVEPGVTGVLGERLRRRDGAVRSAHPTHSVAALGAGAEELCAGHEELAATDVGTPLERLARADGWVLLLGVGHVVNTTVHVGEFVGGAPYLDLPLRSDWPRVHEVVLPEGVRTFEYGRFAGCSRAFGVVERGLRARGVVRDGRVGYAETQLVPGGAVVEETIALLEGAEDALLCNDPSPAHRCVRARARARAEA